MKVKRSKSLSPEPSSSRDYKRSKIESEDATNETDFFSIHILDFSDDVLLNILKHLSPQDLLATSLCCKRLDRICRDRTLWRTIDCRNSCLAMKDLAKYKKFLQPSTKKFAVRGATGTCLAFQKGFLDELGKSCPNLKELIIEQCNISAHTVRICKFPTTLEKLSLNGCALHNFSVTNSYLYKIDRIMPHLTCLILSNCTWLTGHSLMVLSKIPKLTELRLDSCSGIGECVAYASLATRFGFKTLEILDLRFTALGDSEICCFSSTSTLTHLYLEYPKSPAREYFQRYEARLPDRRGVPVYEDPNLLQYIAEEAVIPWNAVDHCLISDRAVCALGAKARHQQWYFNPRPNDDGVQLENVATHCNPNLKCLVLRNYTLISNESLRHLSVNAEKLEYLDVTGTSVTEEAVRNFKVARPLVKIITSFNEE